MNRPQLAPTRPPAIPAQPRRLPRVARKTLWQVFAAPTVIAVISLIGLVSALTGDGVRNIVSWAALGVPVVIAIRAWRRRG